MAQELIELYARRRQAQGYAFPPDGDWQNDFETRFEYDETDDQLHATAEIKQDMEKPYPMDRLLCGDVGVGKTEVALRAAFKCVMGGKQCALLAPTTLLAWQHYNTLLSRMEAFPVKVGMLSRFRTAKQQRRPCGACSPAAWTSWWAPTACSPRMCASTTWALSSSMRSSGSA